MENDKPIYWDEPKGVLIRIICVDRIFDKEKIKETFIERVKRKYPIRVNFDEYFEKCWSELCTEKIIEKKEKGYQIAFTIYWKYKKYIDELSEEEFIELELEWEDDPLIYWVKKELGGDFMTYHFFLGGKDLHRFLSRIMKKANRITVMSPYIQEVTMTKLICDKKDKSYVITRFDGSESHKKGIAKLAENNVVIDYVDSDIYDIHGKILIADDKVAVVSSYNLDEYSESKNWEAGIVSYDPSIIESIKKSIKDNLKTMPWTPDLEYV